MWGERDSASLSVYAFCSPNALATEVGAYGRNLKYAHCNLPPYRTQAQDMGQQVHLLQDTCGLGQSHRNGAPNFTLLRCVVEMMVGIGDVSSL